MTFRLLTDFDALQAWAPAWDDLVRRSGPPEPMQAPGWLLTWWRAYGRGSDRSLSVGLFHDGDQLIGVAPLCVRRFRHRGGIWMARLEFLGADMDEHDGVCSEFLGVIVHAGHEERVLESLVNHLDRGAFGPWQELVFSAMNGADALPGRLVRAFEAAGFRPRQRVITDAPYVPLPDCWDDFLTSLCARKRRYLLRSWKAFEAWAGGAWEVKRVITLADLTEGQAILHRLHNHRWQEGAGIEGMFSKPRFAQFHQEYMADLFRAGALDLFWVNVRGAAIAISYQIRTPRKVYFYQGGRELSVPAAVRPGIIISMLAIQNAIADGLGNTTFWVDRHNTSCNSPRFPGNSSRFASRDPVRRNGCAAVSTRPSAWDVKSATLGAWANTVARVVRRRDGKLQALDAGALGILQTTWRIVRRE